MKKCKPISRVLSFSNPDIIWLEEVPVIYLAPALRQRSIDLPTLSPCKQGVSEQLIHQGLFDLSTHKVYPATVVTHYPVGSYPTISPLPWTMMALGGIFSVALSVTGPSPIRSLPVRKYGALRCPDFPLSR